MKKLAAVMLVALLLAGCGTPPTKSDEPQKTNASGSDYTEVTVKLSDGRSVLCLRPTSGTSASLSCDWEHAK